MGKRRSGRELAFRLIFQCDVGGLPLDDVLATAREVTTIVDDVWKFAVKLAYGVWGCHLELDDIITRYATGWALDRIANADRNLLRLALYEIIYCEETPVSVAINEAVELAKLYSTGDSARFVNGILGGYCRDHPAAVTRGGK